MHDHHKLPHDIAMKRFRNKCGGALCTLKLLLFKLMYWDYLETQIIIRYWAAHFAFIEGLAFLFMVVITRYNASTVLLNSLLYINIQYVPKYTIPRIIRDSSLMITRCVHIVMALHYIIYWKIDSYTRIGLPVIFKMGTN